MPRTCRFAVSLALFAGLTLVQPAAAQQAEGLETDADRCRLTVTRGCVATEALIASEKIEDPLLQTTARIALSRVYAAAGSYGAAFNLINELPFPGARVAALANIADILTRTGQYTDGRATYDRARELHRQIVAGAAPTALDGPTPWHFGTFDLYIRQGLMGDPEGAVRAAGIDGGPYLRSLTEYYIVEAFLREGDPYGARRVKAVARFWDPDQHMEALRVAGGLPDDRRCDAPALFRSLLPETAALYDEGHAAVGSSPTGAAIVLTQALQTAGTERPAKPSRDIRMVRRQAVHCALRDMVQIGRGDSARETVSTYRRLDLRAAALDMLLAMHLERGDLASAQRVADSMPPGLVRMDIHTAAPVRSDAVAEIAAARIRSLDADAGLDYARGIEAPAERTRALIAAAMALP